MGPIQEAGEPHTSAVASESFSSPLLDIGGMIAAIVAWFAILFTGRYPRILFEYIEGVLRWHNRVGAYAFLLITDRYPPFSLQP